MLLVSIIQNNINNTITTLMNSDLKLYGTLLLFFSSLYLVVHIRVMRRMKFYVPNLIES